MIKKAVRCHLCIVLGDCRGKGEEALMYFLFLGPMVRSAAIFSVDYSHFGATVSAVVLKNMYILKSVVTELEWLLKGDETMG